MTRRKEEPAREKRIAMEIVVDAYDAWEQAMGWYYHLQDTLKFPFKAKMLKELITPVSWSSLKLLLPSPLLWSSA
jgi:hypothetical protein